jgi:CBS domain-containing protein
MMKVREVMTTDVECCDPGADLASAAMVMWRRNCGVVPVLASDTCKVVGVITDRDICIAVATRHRRAGEISVAEACSRTVHVCGPDDDIDSAMETMRAHQVRRLPVVGEDGRIVGIVSLYDLLVRTQPRSGRRGERIKDTALIELARGICAAPELEIAPTRPARRRTRPEPRAASRRTAAA